MRAVSLACALAACGGAPHYGGPCDAFTRDAGATTVLFDGTDLAGWDGDPTVWSVDNGAIVASASGVDHNTFLIYQGRTFGDFTLRAQVRIAAGGNSGLQYRSTVLDPARRVVGGYQLDIGDGVWGDLYEEQLGRGLLVRASDACARAVRVGDWNDVDVTAIGCHVVQHVDGELCGEFGENDPTRPASGVVALQYHQPGGFRLEVRAISVVELE